MIDLSLPIKRMAPLSEKPLPIWGGKISLKKECEGECPFLIPWLLYIFDEVNLLSSP